MAKLTILSVAGLGAAVLGAALISDALSQNNYELSGNTNIVRSVPKALAASTNVITSFLSLSGDETELPIGMEFSNLLRVAERTYDVRFDTSVSGAILSQISVLKIGFGQKSVVQMVTTASGTYSSDGLASRHVLYPGVEVSLVLPSVEREHVLQSGPGSAYCVEEGSFAYCA